MAHRAGALRLRPLGSELPWQRELQRRQPHQPGAGTWELLFQQAVGRYIEIRLTLRGSRRSSPKIRALRAYYPRFSYAQYLPAVYREDSGSASFVDRFLANFEGVLTELEGRIASAEVLLDHAAAPADALDWLASWLGATLDPRWDEARRRLFIDNAVQLYRTRGTRRGLLAAVRLAVDACPSADDLFDDDRAGGPFGFRISEGFAGGTAAGAHRLTMPAPVGLPATPTERLRMREPVTVRRTRTPGPRRFRRAAVLGTVSRRRRARGPRHGARRGSRFSALVLGAGYLGQSLLAERHPWDVNDRRVVARDREGFDRHSGRRQRTPIACCDFQTATPDTAPLNPHKRVRHFAGLVLGPEEFQQDQLYFMERDRLHQRALHGYGTALGLGVRVRDNASGRPEVLVDPGLAVTPRGESVCVARAQCADLDGWLSIHGAELPGAVGSPPGSPPLGSPGSPPSAVTLWVLLCARECSTDMVPVLGDPCRTAADATAPSRIADDFELKLALLPPTHIEEAAVRLFGEALRSIDVNAGGSPLCRRPRSASSCAQLRQSDRRPCADAGRSAGHRVAAADAGLAGAPLFVHPNDANDAFLAAWRE